MKIAKLSEVPKELHAGPKGYPTMFTKPVIRQVPPIESKEYDLSIVTFGKGVRNKFHAHTHEQILIVTGGKGIVATEKEERVVTAGDIILFSAGEKHWHGATEDSEFSHLYFKRIESKLTQLED